MRPTSLSPTKKFSSVPAHSATTLLDSASFLVKRRHDDSSEAGLADRLAQLRIPLTKKSQINAKWLLSLIEDFAQTAHTRPEDLHDLITFTEDVIAENCLVFTAGVNLPLLTQSLESLKNSERSTYFSPTLTPEHDLRLNPQTPPPQLTNGERLSAALATLQAELSWARLKVYPSFFRSILGSYPSEQALSHLVEQCKSSPFAFSLMAQFILDMHEAGFSMRNVSGILTQTGNHLSVTMQQLRQNKELLKEIMNICGFSPKNLSSILAHAAPKMTQAILELYNNSGLIRYIQKTYNLTTENISGKLGRAGNQIATKLNHLLAQLQALDYIAKASFELAGIPPSGGKLTLEQRIALLTKQQALLRGEESQDLLGVLKNNGFTVLMPNDYPEYYTITLQSKYLSQHKILGKGLEAKQAIRATTILGLYLASQFNVDELNFLLSHNQLISAEEVAANRLQYGYYSLPYYDGTLFATITALDIRQAVRLKRAPVYFINQCKLPSEANVIFNFQEIQQKNYILVMATRDINPGTELLTDYNAARR